MTQPRHEDSAGSIARPRHDRKATATAAAGPQGVRIMGLHAEIYRASYDSPLCEMQHAREVCIINAPGPFIPDEKHPAVILESGYNGQHTAQIVRAVPCDNEGNVDRRRGWCAGGSFVATSDSRFHDLCEKLTGQRFHGAVDLQDYDQFKETR
jgi:hypothetical protein